MAYNLYDLQNALQQAQESIEEAIDYADELEDAEERVEELEGRVEELEERVEELEERVEELEEENDCLKIDAKEYFLTLQKNKLIEMMLKINDLETIVKLQDFIDNENIKNELTFEQTEE